MRIVFKLDKETKNYVKYRQEGGINVMYLPRPAEGTPVTLTQFPVDVPDTTGSVA
jgi:hypothetical protein